MRVFAISDIHLDFERNRRLWQSVSAQDFTSDILLLAGDVTHDRVRLSWALESIRGKFAGVAFVPGNHELWIVQDDGHQDSLEKFRAVLELCRTLDIYTDPFNAQTASGRNPLWIVPLFSWYAKPEEGGDSLYVPKEGEDPTLSMWSDNYLVRWPRAWQGTRPADYFLKLNEARISRRFRGTVITLSHFLTRADLLYGTAVERAAATAAHPEFNFSRVAGTSNLDRQIRVVRSSVHVYGHQHRDRDRQIAGTRYISHCLGYPREKLEEHKLEFKLVWDDTHTTPPPDPGSIPRA